MFFYLSKKIAIPKFSHINCISWNQHGWIAIGGGNNGLLKILNIEKQSSINGSINLSSNQALEGHSGEINCIAWNPHFNKLTTSDENGLIIVWTLHKNIWYEEMINNRNKSIVKDMKWNYDGQKICIIYEDGAIIVGSVDGSRIWNKELEFQLKAIEWSPDGSNLLLVSPNNIINIYDMKGSVTASITIDHPDVQLASIICVKGSNTKRFMLYISFDNGVILLWNGSDRSYRVLLNTEKETILCSWSHQCDVVAMCSKAQANHAADTNMKEHNVIQFYNRSGILIQTVKLPGSTLSGIAWEQSGLRLAATVDSHLYFVQVRPSYNFVYFASTVVYALRYESIKFKYRSKLIDDLFFVDEDSLMISM